MIAGVTKTHASSNAAAATDASKNGAASNGYANTHHRQKQNSATTQARTALQARYEYAYGELMEMLS